MDHEELECLAKQLKHEIQSHGRTSATILYNDETNRADIMDQMERLLGKENFEQVDFKLIYNEFHE